MGKVTRLRPKRHDVIVEALQLVLDFGGHYELDQHTKDGLAAAVGKLAPPEKWGYVMLNPDQQRAVLKAIKAGPLPLQTMAAWNACISFIAYDRDGEIMARRTQIAEAADLTPQNASTALSRLVELGVLERIRRGRYRVNPHVAWSGPLHKREIAAKEQAPVPAGAPKLRVVPTEAKP
jgi:DNA-binding transcriptional ArsR family regulator